jgi:hypothetical protein
VGLTVIVNMLTVAHKGSNGMLISFPDVCKTPTPAGPVPIPYPNIAKSSDVVSGSSTVKMDGGMIMNKGSNTMMSTGDEAGAAMGVVSNKIKGKAEFVNYSFDVKVDGKNVCRLTDPAQSNMGSGNSIAPACIQAPLLAWQIQVKACDKTKEKEKAEDKKEKGESTQWDDSGVHEPHKQAFQDVATKHQLVIFVRRTNKYCVENGWIPGKHQPKPHAIINAKTIKPDNVKLFKGWLGKYYGADDPKFYELKRKLFGIDDGGTAAGTERAAAAADEEKGKNINKFKVVKPPLPEFSDIGSFYGVVMDQATGEPYVGYGKYRGKWITGDYDLMDVVKHNDDKCGRLTEDAFKNLMHELNKEMKWDGIQHGPQAYWIPKPGELKGNLPLFSLPDEITKFLKVRAEGKAMDVPGKKIAPDRPPLPILDTKLNVVAPGGRVAKLDGDEVVDALICCGCHREDQKGMKVKLKKPVAPEEE